MRKQQSLKKQLLQFIRLVVSIQCIKNKSNNFSSTFPFHTYRRITPGVVGKADGLSFCYVEALTACILQYCSNLASIFRQTSTCVDTCMVDIHQRAQRFCNKFLYTFILRLNNTICQYHTVLSRYVYDVYCYIDDFGIKLYMVLPKCGVCCQESFLVSMHVTAVEPFLRTKCVVLYVTFPVSPTPNSGNVSTASSSTSVVSLQGIRTQIGLETDDCVSF